MRDARSREVEVEAYGETGCEAGNARSAKYEVEMRNLIKRRDMR